MKKKDIYTIACLISCLTVIMFPGINYAGPNSSAGCSIDMDFTTNAYESKIDPGITAHINDIISVAIVAQRVTNIDTYQAEIQYDKTALEFIEGYEDVPMQGIENLLKRNGGTTLGFQATEKHPGAVNVANTLAGTDTSEAPEGSGIIAIIRFKVLRDTPAKLSLGDVHFVDSFQQDDLITNKTDGKIN